MLEFVICALLSVERLLPGLSLGHVGFVGIAATIAIIIS